MLFPPQAPAEPPSVEGMNQVPVPLKEPDVPLLLPPRLRRSVRSARERRAGCVVLAATEATMATKIVTSMAANFMIGGKAFSIGYRGVERFVAVAVKERGRVRPAQGVVYNEGKVKK